MAEISDEDGNKIIEALKLLAKTAMFPAMLAPGAFGLNIGALVSGEQKWEDLPEFDKAGILSFIGTLAGGTGVAGLGAAGIGPAVGGEAAFLSPFLGGGAAGAGATGAGGLAGLSIGGISAGKLLGVGLAYSLGKEALNKYLDIIGDINFGKFLQEESEQQANMAGYMQKGDYLGLASIISQFGIPTYERGESYYDKFSGPLFVNPISKFFYPGALGKGEEDDLGAFYANHEAFRTYIDTQIQELLSRGAWVMDGSNGGWGRPALADDLQKHLINNPGDIRFYQDYINELKSTDAGIEQLYQYVKGGFLPSYLVGGLLEQQFKDRIKSENNALQEGNIGYNYSTVESAAKSLIYWSKKNDGEWSDAQKQDAQKIGDVLYTMIQSGTVTDPNAGLILSQLRDKVRTMTGITPTWKQVPLETKTNPITAPKTASVVTYSDFGPTSTYEPPETQQSTIDLRKSMEDVAMGKPGAVPTQEEALKIATDLEEYAKKAAGVEGIRGVGFTGQATEAEKAAMEKVGTGFAWQPREGLTRAEETAMRQIENGIRSAQDIRNIDPTAYQGLVNKGLLTQEGHIVSRSPAEMAGKEPGAGLSSTDLAGILDNLQKSGLISKEQAQEAFQKEAKLTEEGYFTYPKETGYTYDELQRMAQFGTPQEQETARRQLEIEAKRQKREATTPEGGFFGYQQGYTAKPMSEKQAGYEVSQLEKQYEGLSPQDLSDIYDALQTRAGSSMFFEEFETPSAMEAALQAAGITRYEPTEKGYGPTYGAGGIRGSNVR